MGIRLTINTVVEVDTPQEAAKIMEAVCGLSTPAQQLPVQGNTVEPAIPAPSIPQDTPFMQAPANPAAPVLPTAPVVPAAPIVPAAPVVPSPFIPAPAAMPNTLTAQQLNEACKALIDAGKLDELRRAMREQIGVESLSQMTPEQLTAFAVIVRGMGAVI